MASPFGPCGTQYVKAYIRKDGKYVQPHNRTIPSQERGVQMEVEMYEVAFILLKCNRSTPSGHIRRVLKSIN